jgi:hypothetical protein
MLVPSEIAYEEVRRRQRELQEKAACAQVLARVRREAMLASAPTRRRWNWLARNVRADVARP